MMDRIRAMEHRSRLRKLVIGTDVDIHIVEQNIPKILDL